MKIEIVMPKMGESVNEGTILKWHKKQGDKVSKDEIIFEISTDKVDTEIPSPDSGILSEIRVFEQETVGVGTVVAYLETEGEVGEQEQKLETEIKPTSQSNNQVELIDIIMPKMGESVMQGTILKWHKKVGDKVLKDETLFEISTDKVDTEVPSPVEGVLASILVLEQETVDVGVVVGKISPSGYVLKINNEENKIKEEPVINKVTTEVPKEKSEIKSEKGNRFYSPLVLNIANKENVSFSELENIQGSGINGRVTKNDILAYIEQRKKSGTTLTQKQIETSIPVKYESKIPEVPFDELSKDRVEVFPMDNMRQVIMQHMVKSRDTSVHVMGVQEADMSKVEEYIKQHKEVFLQREGVKLTYMPFIISAVVKALKDYPFVNASIKENTIVKKNYINIGMAVALDPMGLIVPVIKNADEKNLVGLAKSVYDLATRAKTKKLLPDEVKDGTFTITNYGVFGTLFGNPIINQPEIAILGIGSVTKKPVVIEVNNTDVIAIKPMMYLSLSHDHRLVDGALAGKFLMRVKEYLENFDSRII